MSDMPAVPADKDDSKRLRELVDKRLAEAPAKGTGEAQLGTGRAARGLPYEVTAAYQRRRQHARAAVCGGGQPHSWFEHFDLVFVDPPHTGFSITASDDARKKMLSVDGDVEVLAEGATTTWARPTAPPITRWRSWTHRPRCCAGSRTTTTMPAT